MKTPILLLLVACVPYGKFIYETPYGTVDSVTQLDGRALVNKMKLASDYYDSKFGVGEFKRIGMANRIHVRSECRWPTPGGLAHGYSTTFMVELSPNLSAIVHEFIHQKENEMLMSGTMSHQGWNDKKARLDGSYTSNYDIAWGFEAMIVPLPEMHPLDFDMSSLEQYGNDGFDCWGE